MPESDRPQSWWQSLPGILTATATVLTALSGLLVILYQNGVLGSSSAASPAATAEVIAPAADSAPQQPPASASTSSLASDPRPATDSRPEVATDSAKKVTHTRLTLVDGTITLIRVGSLRSCTRTRQTVTSAGGQEIPFARMRTLEVSQRNGAQPSAARRMRIQLATGKTDVAELPASCRLFAQTDAGAFQTDWTDIRRIDFRQP